MRGTGTRRTPRSVGAVLACWTLSIAPLAGQAPDSSPWSGGAGLAGLFVVGESSDFLDGGWGVTAHVRVDPAGWRGFGGWVEAGWIPLEEDRGGPGQEAHNTLVHLIAGPAWGVALGSIHPRVGGSAGIVSSLWRTRQGSVEERGSGYGVVWGGWAALGVGSRGRSHPVLVELQGRVLQTGVLPFARAPVPIGPQPEVGTTEQDVVFLSLALAVNVGF